MTGADVVAGGLGALAGVAATYAALRPRLARPVRVEETVPAAAGTDEELTARVVSTLPFSVFTVDARGRVRVFNRASVALFGVRLERAIGRALIEVIPSVELERMVDAALRGETRTQDIAFGSGARERYLGISVQPYQDGAIAIAADRTGYLANERMRREFTGNVSHELRTPLSAMKLMLETVLVAEDDAEARALFLPQIAAEVERMIRIVEDLLELARSEAGVMTLRRERFEMNELAASCVATFVRRAESLRVSLVLDAPRRIAVSADRGRLTQVVVNLLDNALRHTPPGGSVTVTVTREENDAVLRVRDTGSGIPFADLPRIFERFYVVDRSRSREHQGTGLGLAIAKHIVEAHRGRLEVDSVYGRGATFTMRIPALDEA